MYIIVFIVYYYSLFLARSLNTNKVMRYSKIEEDGRLKMED